MPLPLETMDRTQKAVLWAKSTTVDDYGQPTVSSPVEITVRWNTQQADALDSQGRPITLDASVVVDREIEIGSQMWEGELADWLGTGSGGTDSEVMEVVTYSEAKDLKGRYTRREVGLKRFRDAPATG